jgi:hypothetical protein
MSPPARRPARTPTFVARDQLFNPDVPRGTDRHAGCPVDDGGGEDKYTGDGSKECARDQRHKSTRLSGGTEHRPIPMGTGQADSQRGGKLENAARHERQCGDKTGCDFSHPQCEHERRQIGFANAHHYAERDAFDKDRSKIAADVDCGLRTVVRLEGLHWMIRLRETAQKPE